MKQPSHPQKTTQYVLCFGQKSYDQIPTEILLVRKPPQSLHEGLLNLPGGFLLENFTHKEMALREMHLETGLEGKDPQRIGRVNGPQYTMEVWRMIVPTNQALHPEPNQPALWMPWLELKERNDVLPQLLLIAPLAMAGMKDWILNDQEHCLVGRRYQGHITWPDQKNESA